MVPHVIESSGSHRLLVTSCILLHQSPVTSHQSPFPMLTNIIQRASLALRGRYVRMLEEEVARLRAENRALVNSLLGTAGFPPIALDEEVRRGPVAMSPVRRRTWTQIAREREAAAGKIVTRDS